MLDRFTIIRSVDARYSNHEPNKVFQTANREAAPRLNPSGEMYPAIGSVVAKHHGANRSGLPPYVAFQTSRTHVAYAGYLGQQYDPFIANRAARLPIYTNVGVDTGRTSEADFFRLPHGLTHERLLDRRALLDDLDRLRSGIDRSGAVEAMDRFGQEAVEMLVGRRSQAAFDLSQEPEAVRDRYGKHLWCQQALLARRLVEAGVAFVTIDLSYHPASGTWDNHGDNIPPYGGISRGLKPLLPLFDHLITTLVTDLEERGLLDDVLVLALGEFGRTPMMGTQGSTDGRNHWPVVMSMLLAGGGLRHGQVIGSTEAGRGAHQGSAGDAGRPGGNHLRAHGRAARCHLLSMRPADHGPSSSTADRSPNCSELPEEGRDGVRCAGPGSAHFPREPRAFFCHLCPTWRHSLQTRACRLAMPEEVAKIGAGGHDDDNAADRGRIRVGFQACGSSCVGGARRRSKSWSGGTNRWSVPWRTVPAATWRSARTWPRRHSGRRGGSGRRSSSRTASRPGSAGLRGTSRRTPGARRHGRSNPPRRRTF